jgi:hypothetical protein
MDHTERTWTGITGSGLSPTVGFGINGSTAKEIVVYLQMLFTQ